MRRREIYREPEQRLDSGSLEELRRGFLELDREQEERAHERRRREVVRARWRSQKARRRGRHGWFSDGGGI